MSLRPIPKTVFRCYKTSGGKTLIETPIRLDSAGLEPSNMLVIQDADITVQQKSACFPKDSADITAKYEIMAVLGVLELSLGKYLLAVATRVLVATIQSHKVWKITSGIIIPLGKSSASPEAMDDLDLAKYAYDKGLLASVSKLMSDGFMYYSTSYDLTHSLQHNSLLNAKGLATVVDDRYYFNNFVQSTLTKASLSDKSVSDWITKTIFGFVGSTDMDCTFITTGIEKAKAYRVILISRINRKRLGARYVRRGLDLNGNAANNVEMEQIVFSLDVLKEKAISSFCQIRGSAPSIWGQELDLSYRPKLHLADPNKDEVWSSTKKHFDDLKHQYIGEKSVPGTDKGGVVCVNLLDDIGFEKPLTDIFEKSVKRFNDSKLIYESFPVTKWCKKMNYKNMDILMDRVRVNVLNSGWLLADGDIPTLNTADKLRCSRIQTGVVRVSCLDSLDRTNLTCSMFAKYVLPYQIQGISADLPAVQVLASTGVAPHEARDPAASVRLALADSLPSLVNLWADSGDAVSILYAGTCALKGDVVRTGKRQLLQGSLNDGLNSLTRYYLNNFMDGHKQDLYDLWTGNTSLEEINNQALLKGKTLAHYIRKPIVPKSAIIPTIVIETIEPILQGAAEYSRRKAALREDHIDKQGQSHTLVGLAVESLKVASPSRISSVVEFILALAFAGWIIFLVKVFNIRAQHVVDTPRLTKEYSKVKELDS